EVIVNCDAPAAVASASVGADGLIPPKIVKQKLARKNKLKAKSTLLLAIPNEHLLKFHGIKDAKILWEAIKTRSEGLDKTYDRFQKLISQLEIHGEDISQEDANLKLLRSLSSAWNNIALIMRNKSDLDTLSMEKFVQQFEDNISSTNEAVNTAHDVSTASSQGQTSFSTYADDVMRGHFARECMAPRNQGNRNRDDPRRIVPVETSTNALVVQDMIGYQLGLESLEARIVVHKKNEVVYEEDISFLKYDVKVRDNSITKLKNQLAEALKEKDDLKLKLENQMDENGLHDCHLNKSEVFESASDSSVNEIEEENNQVDDRFKKVEGYHAVPPPYTSFAGLDDYVYKTSWHTSPNQCQLMLLSKALLKQQHQFSTASLRAFNQKSAAKINNFNEKVNTARVNNITTAGLKAVVSAAVGNGENAVKSSTCWIWRLTGNVIDHNSKDSGSYMLKRFDYVDLQGRLYGCSRHMTGNKSFLTDYQEIDGGFVAFGGSPKGGKITGKGIKEYILLPLLYDSPQSSEDAVADDTGKNITEEPANKGQRNGQEKEEGASNKEGDQNVQDFRAALDNLLIQQKEDYANNTNRDIIVSPSVSDVGQSFNNADLPTDPLMPDLEDTVDLLNTSIFSGAYDDEDEGVKANLNNLETTMNVSPIPTTRIHKDHPKNKIIGDINSATQTRRMTKIFEEHALKAKRTTEISQSSRPIHLVANETVYKEWEDRMERAATTASSLEVEQDSGNINRIQSMATLNESFPQGTNSGSGPRCQDTIFRGAEAQIRFEAASKQSNDPPLSRVNTLGSGEDNMKLKELMELCMKLSERILDIKIDRVNW
ncbi:hypothetical protein Tco_0640502, partial [Tanacetum coccineum]